MIDNLTEAITHEREVAKEKKKDADYLDAPYGMDTSARTECLECAKEHEQLAEWLEELAERREAGEWISVKDKLPEPLISVIVTDNNDVFVAWYNEGWKSSDSQFDEHTPIVAWRPIPRYTESEQSYEAGLAQGKHDRPKGEWTVTKLQHGEDVTCPFCNARPTRSEYGYYLRDKFCHECGADMRKGGAE